MASKKYPDEIYQLEGKLNTEYSREAAARAEQTLTEIDALANRAVKNIQKGNYSKAVIDKESKKLFRRIKLTTIKATKAERAYGEQAGLEVSKIFKPPTKSIIDASITTPLKRGEISKIRLVKGWDTKLSNAVSASFEKSKGEAVKVLSKAVSDVRNIDTAGRDLLRAAGGELKKETLPKVLKDLQKAAESLSGDSWERAIQKVKAQASRLRDKRKAYKELIDRVSNPKFKKKNLNRLLEQHLKHKQRFNAEQILITEGQNAKRTREINEMGKKSYITGGIWRLNSGSRRSYVKKRKRPVKRVKYKGKTLGKGKRCICENNAGGFYPMKDIKAMGGRMDSHPNCRCYFEWTYNDRFLDK